MSTKEYLLERLGRESEVTAKVMRAFPAEKLDFKPHERSRNAHDLIAVFIQEMKAIPGMIEGQVEFPKADNLSSVEDAASKFEKAVAQATEAIQKTSDHDLEKDLDFFGWKTTRINAVWEMLLDNIHHRGQLSVYVRMTGGKVPQIYGPSADYPT